MEEDDNVIDDNLSSDEDNESSSNSSRDGEGGVPHHQWAGTASDMAGLRDMPFTGQPGLLIPIPGCRLSCINVENHNLLNSISTITNTIVSVYLIAKPDARRAAPARCDDSGRGAAEAQSSLTGFNVNGVSRMRS
ncbi:hypothetical protein J6590_094173 [Homalodisca vitripennis]|nr:hypothetical protein J6590_094173 [Homalodisca vitripennis]